MLKLPKDAGAFAGGRIKSLHPASQKAPQATGRRTDRGRGERRSSEASQWGTSEEVTQVASSRTEALRFLAHPEKTLKYRELLPAKLHISHFSIFSSYVHSTFRHIFLQVYTLM